MQFSNEDLKIASVFAAAAYNSTFAQTNGEVSAKLLSQLGSGWIVQTFGGSHGIQTIPGSAGIVIETPGTDNSGYFRNGNAAAIAATNNGTLVLSFRGSDPGFVTDFKDAVKSPIAHYNKLKEFISDALLFAQNPNNQITKVIVTGHSLGGEMAQLFATNFTAGDGITYYADANSLGLQTSNVNIITFGNPGLPNTSAFVSSDIWSSRIFNFGHSDDIVFNHSVIFDALSNHKRSGTDYLINSTAINGNTSPINIVDPYQTTVLFASIGATEHKIENYLASVKPLIDYSFASYAQTKQIGIGSNLNDDAIVAGGLPTDGGLLIGLRGNDFLLGRPGADILIGGHGNDTINGGGGDQDTAVYIGQYADYTIEINTGVVRISALVSDEGMDTLQNVEYAKFLGDGRIVPLTAPPSGPLPIVNISNAQSLNEGNAGTRQARFEISLSAPTTVPVTVRYSTADGSALAVSDYISKSAVITFLPGQPLKQYINIDVVGDRNEEASQSFTVELSNVSSGATPGDTSGSALILNDDGPALPPPPLPTVTVSDVQILEGNSGTTFAFVWAYLSSITTANVTVNWALNSGSAGSFDFVSASGQLSISEGYKFAVIPVQILGDLNDENEESFTLTLSNPTGATIAGSTATITVTDDDDPPAPLPTVSISNAAAVAEGNPGDPTAKFFDFKVSLSAPATSPISVNWFTGDGSASYVSGDYEARSDLIHFSVGEQFQHITNIAVNGDFIVEGHETVQVSLWGANGANIGASTATGTIIDNDTAEIRITDSAVVETDEGAIAAKFYVSLSKPSQSAVTVQYTTAPGTGTSSQDFLPISGTLVFAAGETLKPIEVLIGGDTLFESSEVFTLQLSNPVGATIVDASAIGTIIPDDSAQLYNRVGTNGIVVAPGSFSPVDSSLHSNSLDGRFVAFESHLSNLVLGDFNNLTDIFVLDKSSGEIARVNLYPNGQQLVNGHQSNHPTISADGRYVAYQSSDQSIVLGDTNGKKDIFVVDRLSGKTERVSISGSGGDGNGDATAPSISADGRYVAFVSEASNLVADDTNGVADIFVYDRQNETLERVNLGIDGANANNVSAAPVISADGRVIAFNSKADNLVANDSNDRWDTFVFDRDSSEIQRVTGEGSNGGYNNQGQDYRAGLSADGRYVAFNSDWSFVNQDNQRWDTYVFDRIEKSYSLASVSLSGTNGNGDSLGHVQLSPDGMHVLFTSHATDLAVGFTGPNASTYDAVRQAAPLVSVSDVSIVEGQNGTKNAQFTITLTAPTVQTVTLNYSTEDGSALAGVDYLTRVGSISFAPGDPLSKKVDVPLLGDLFYEDAETFGLRLSSPTNAVLIDDLGIVTIHNDDIGPPTVSIFNASFNEGNTSPSVASFRLSLSGSWTESISVNFSTMGASAAAGEDFESVSSGLITFAPGEKEKTIDILLSADNKFEGNEVFSVKLEAATGATIASSVAVGTILNDDSLGGLTFDTTVRVNLAQTGDQTALAGSFHPTISGDGRYVAFDTSAANLVPSDGFQTDVFFVDRDTGAIEKITIGLGGAQANGGSYLPDMSSTGQFVAFRSDANNLVGGDAGGSDIFVWNRDTKLIERVSVSTSGAAANDFSDMPSLSSDGRFVAFHSSASNLVGGDSNGVRDIFVRDRQNATTEIISVNSAEVGANAESLIASISGDGRYVAFVSKANNLVAGDSNSTYDVFLRDRALGETTRVSVSSAGTEGNGISDLPSVSADGRFVAFMSQASNLVANDINGVSDIFVRNVETGEVERVSVSAEGFEANGASLYTTISADGRYVGFVSSASNLVAGDTNGTEDAFIIDRETSKISRISLTEAGAEGTGVFNDEIDLSADGIFTVYASSASNLVAKDTNGLIDIFVSSQQAPSSGPTVSISSGALLEGNSGNRNIIFTVTLSSASASNVIVDWSTTDGSATAGLDYLQRSGTLVFTPTDPLTKQIIVPIIGDTKAEADEVFSVILSSITNGTIATGSATGIVLNDDAAVGSNTLYSAADFILDSTTPNGTLIGTADVSVVGNNLANLLTGNSGNNAIFGLGGLDTIFGGDGDDLIDGGGGSDRLDGGQGFDTAAYLFSSKSIVANLASGIVTDDGGSDRLVGVEAIVGSGFDDKLTGSGGNDKLYGAAGKDYVDGGLGQDTLIGGTDDDKYIVENANDVIVEEEDAGIDVVHASVTHVLDANVENLVLIGSIAIDGAGNDLANNLLGNNAANKLSGNVGNDTLIGGTENDILNGGDGNDTLEGGAGNDAVDGGAGDDVIKLGGLDAVGDTLIQGGADDDKILVTGLTALTLASFNAATSSIEVWTGNNQAILGTTTANIFDFGGLTTATGIKYIDGAAGNDTITGTLNADEIRGGADNDTLNGGFGSDLLTGGAGIDVLNGGDDLDTASYASSTAVTIDLLLGTVAGGEAIGDTLISIENLIGGTGIDKLTGNNDANVLKGGAGNDILVGNGGNDTLDGGAGIDNIDGGAGDDTILIGGSDALTDIFKGGADTDTVQVTGLTALSLTNFNAGTAEIEVWAGNNQAILGTTGVNVLDFTALTAATGILFIDGGAGNDTITGSLATDDIRGGAGNDTLNGGDGNDTLEGGAGNDTLTGGADQDTFVFKSGGGLDIATDYVAGTDDFDFRGVTSLTTFTQLQAMMSDNGLGDVVIAFNATTKLTIEDTTLGILATNQNDFMLN